MGLALALAVLIGLTLGLLGGGGSILTVPILVYAVGLEAKPAIATSLLVVAITAAMALLPHARAGNVRWRIGAVFGAAGMAGAFAGGHLARYLAGHLLLLLFAAMMVATAIAMWRGRRESGPSQAASPARPTLRIIADGLAVGLATGLVGAGGGFLVVPALVLLGGLPMATAVGTSLLVIAMKSVAGFLGYASHVVVDYRLAFGIAGAAAVGSLLGARLVAVLDPDRLRRGFAAFVLAMAGLMVYQERATLANLDWRLLMGGPVVVAVAWALFRAARGSAGNRSPSSGLSRRLVLVGAGHAHVEILRRWGTSPEPDVELTLLVDRERAIYSGMVPGFVAGQYGTEEVEIDVPQLAQRAGARLVLGRATSVDPDTRSIQVEGAPPVHYDVASIDVGSSVAGLDLPGVLEHAISTRPISELVAGIAEALARGRSAPGAEPFRAVIVGAGAGGVELAFCLRERLRSEGVAQPEVLLVDSASALLPGAHPRLRRRVERAAAQRGISFRGAVRVAAVEGGSLLLEHGEKLPWDGLIWATGAASHSFLRCGLPVDPRGFVRVGPTLQVVAHPDLFAAGDCASLDRAPDVPKAGVYAVRAGPILAANLRRLLRGKRLRTHRPQRDFLSILNLGDGTAIGTKWGVVIEGGWVMRWKDRIDRAFMEKYQ